MNKAPSFTALACVLARAGSQRLPNKNKRLFAGKPLCQWSLEAALHCPHITHTVLNTDDAELLNLGDTLKIEYPTLFTYARPSHLAQADTPTHATWLDGLTNLPTPWPWQQYTYLMLLQPTSPLRTAEQVSEALALAETSQANAVVSVTPAPHPSRWHMHLDESHRLDAFIQAEAWQTPPPAHTQEYRLNGAIYVVRTRAFEALPTLFQPVQTLAYPMDERSSVDIDTPADWELATYYQKAIRLLQ
ncbi:MAG: cytidylyltransferase domain-containing protein [Vampirovibrionales bacterium]